LNWRATLLKLTEARGNARSRRRNAKSLGNAIDWPLADCLTRQAAQRSAHNRSTRAKPKAESSASATALQCSLRASLWRFTSAEAAHKSLKATQNRAERATLQSRSPYRHASGWDCCKSGWKGCANSHPKLRCQGFTGTGLLHCTCGKPLRSFGLRTK
jgi:hypothetical protein